MEDVKGYIERLDHSMTKKEKLFFLNKINVRKYDYIVDFGCANGRLLYEIDKRLNKKSPTQLFGVDNNPQLVIDYEFAHQFERVEKLDDLPLTEMKYKKVLLILSSVLHEVSDGTVSRLTKFAVDYVTEVVIRDMYFYARDWTMREENKKAQCFWENCEQILSGERYDLLGDFCKCNKDTNLVRKLYEWFLKYTYVQNWETEKHEEYFGKLFLGERYNNARAFVDALREQFYITYVKHYILPYKKKQVLADFGYKMRCNTHVKAIIQRKKPKSMEYIKRQLRK